MGWNEGTNLPPGISDPGNECEFSQREKREFLAERGWKRDDRELREFWIRGEQSLPLDEAFEEVTTEEFDKPMSYRGDCIERLEEMVAAAERSITNGRQNS